MKKFTVWAFITVSFLAVFLLTSYLYFIPKLVSNQSALNFVSSVVKKSMDADLSVTSPELKTSLKPEIEFSVENLSLKKDGEILLNLQNIDSKISFHKLFQKRITVEKLGADDIYVDINRLQQLNMKDTEKKETKKPFFKLDCFNALFYIKNCTILYTSSKGVKAKLLAKDLEISDTRNPKYLHFKAFLDLDHNGEHLKLFFRDFDKVYFQNRQLIFDNFKFLVEHSEITVNLVMDEKGKYDLTLNSDVFEIDNVRRFLNTDLFIPNGHEFLACFKDFSGDFNFNLNLKNDDINGFVKVNKIKAKLIPLADIPLTLTKGLITFNTKDIFIKDFNGYYGKNSRNTINLKGLVLDYPKTVKTDITVNGTVYDEFAQYISKIAGIKINVLKTAKTEFKINFADKTPVYINGNVDIPIGSDVLFEGASISPVKHFRRFNIVMELVENILNIKNIDYHIEDSNNNAKIPLITVNGEVDINTGAIHKIGFDIPEPLPSEFFNVLVGQKIFRLGTISGKMAYLDEGKTPYLDGIMMLKDTIVVGQGVFIKNLTVKTDKNLVRLSSEGAIRRAKYQFSADILNKIIFPVIVQDITLSFDEIDVEKVIQSFAPRPPRPQGAAAQNRPKIEIAKSNISSNLFDVEEKPADAVADAEVQVAFMPNIIEIKKCLLKVKKGAFKKMTIGNLNADLTLTRQGILEIKSNRFDLTDGISTLKVYCDLAKQKYSIKLGAKNVDTDAIATSILNLPKEISGHAKALIELDTDETLKMNGKMQFEINDGSIAKLGLVQYILNMASVFRNPVAMISPSSFVDIVNIPDGSFSKINGNLVIKDNSIQRMMIKSSSPQLSAFIVGRLNLENMDASLRIYTKFNRDTKGIFGFLRKFSLNTLAYRATIYTKEEFVSYYASELEMLPKLETGEDTAQVFLTKFDGDIQSMNFISALQKIK